MNAPGGRRAEFARRIPARVAGVDVYIASAEDTILAKLEWGKTSNSDRQFKDALAIAMTQHVDRQYLATWADELDIVDLLNAALDEADSLDPD
ncbi:MAG: hypothetical protein AAFP84_18165, partial [Actinomycetota bacterium]